jgi:hypothetical protein
VEAATSSETSVTNYHQYDVISQKTVIFISIALKTSNHLQKFVGTFQYFSTHLKHDLVSIYQSEGFSSSRENKHMFHSQCPFSP